MLMPTPVEIVLIGIIALVISVLGNIGGFGGGVILVPSLILIFNVEVKIAVGTVLLTLFFPALIGTIGAARRKEVNFKFGLLFAIPSSAGTISGVFVVNLLSDWHVLIILCILAFFLSLLMLYYSIKRIVDRRKEIQEDMSDDQNSFWSKFTHIKPLIRIQDKNKVYELSIIVIFLSGVIFGLLSGLLGISGGWLKTPFMILAFGFHPLLASGTSLFIIAIKAFVGGIAYISLGYVDWNLFAILAVTMFFGAMIGNYLKSKMRGTQVSLILGITLLSISVFILIELFL